MRAAGGEADAPLGALPSGASDEPWGSGEDEEEADDDDDEDDGWDWDDGLGRLTRAHSGRGTPQVWFGNPALVGPDRLPPLAVTAV